ncbi:hypothetical protein [Burkholderia sp. Bp8998]|uniref:hypothetical protein n=1 Tax=Burkholderia sp. Bp8998 TaxID=2184557 RepID=UPI000F55C24E|nr:hypothetical protein [Burkholderia sp. Bp8998]RQR63874.1 hypothetical protein DIE18_07005 [Burkholderia sp. Bp9125]RQS17116.1 hypothetical protein DIE06_18215 [Burkholderia sp. Bp8998]
MSTQELAPITKDDDANTAAVVAIDKLIANATIQPEPTPYTKREVKFARDILQFQLSDHIRKTIARFERETGAKVTGIAYNPYMTADTPVVLTVYHNDEYVF